MQNFSLFCRNFKDLNFAYLWVVESSAQDVYEKVSQGQNTPSANHFLAYGLQCL
jgi:hypothetical protein